MTEFTKEKVTDMPPSVKGKADRGLALALRELEAGDALFVPAKDGEPLSLAQQRIGAASRNAGASERLSTRIDRARNGVWVFLHRDGDA